MNTSLQNITAIGRSSSHHTLADRKCTPSLKQSKSNLMNRNIPVDQAEAMAQLHTSRAISSIRHSKPVQTQQEENRAPQTLEQNYDNQQKPL